MPVCAAILLTLVASGSAQAAFIGYYDPSNWTLVTNGGSGYADTASAPSAITLWGSNNVIGNDTELSIAAAADGNLSFHWSIMNYDIEGYDFGYWGLNGSSNLLGSTDGTSGSVGPVPVSMGDLIVFRVYCSDCSFGELGLTISNFSAPERGGEIPEPGTVSLVALGVVGLVAGRLRSRFAWRTRR